MTYKQFWQTDRKARAGGAGVPVPPRYPGFSDVRDAHVELFAVFGRDVLHCSGKLFQVAHDDEVHGGCRKRVDANRAAALPPYGAASTSTSLTISVTPLISATAVWASCL